MDNFSALMKLDELVNSMKKKEETNKTRDAIVIALAILGIVAAVAGIAYAVYRFVTPAEDVFDDDFDDDFNDDDELIAFGDEDGAEEKNAKSEDKE